MDTLDIDGDGDDDYMYLLGGSLCIKYTHSPNDRPTPVDTTSTSISYDASLFPRAPNFFHELPSSPGQIEIEFSPASQTERLFRLEFFDRYLEWDSVAGRSDDPSTPRTTIDLVVDVP